MASPLFVNKKNYWHIKNINAKNTTLGRPPCRSFGGQAREMFGIPENLDEK
jgi:hypothetical protein